MNPAMMMNPPMMILSMMMMMTFMMPGCDATLQQRGGAPLGEIAGLPNRAGAFGTAAFQDPLTGQFGPALTQRGGVVSPASGTPGFTPGVDPRTGLFAYPGLNPGLPSRTQPSVVQIMRTAPASPGAIGGTGMGTLSAGSSVVTRPEPATLKPVAPATTVPSTPAVTTPMGPAGRPTSAFEGQYTVEPPFEYGYM